MSNFKIYIDESGHTGANLKDSVQRFFTYGSIIINDNKIPLLTKEIENLPSDTKQRDGDVKGTLLVNKHPELALRFVSEILPTCVEMLFIDVLEKRFMIAAQIVENFFDYVYNDLTNIEWTYKSDRKIEIANFFYDNLSDNLLDALHVSFLSGDNIKLRDAYNELRKELGPLSDIQDIKTLIKGAEPHLEALADALKMLSTQKKRKSAISAPNTTIFFALLQRVEAYQRKKNIQSEIIFDNCTQFNVLLSELTATMIKKKGDKIIGIGEGEMLFLELNTIINFSTKESFENIGLQAADILASTVNYVFGKILHKSTNDLTETDKLLVGFVFCMLHSRVGCCYFTNSNKVNRLFNDIAFLI